LPFFKKGGLVLELKQVTLNAFLDSLFCTELPGVRFFNCYRHKQIQTFKHKEELLSLKDSIQWFTPNVFNLGRCGRTKKNLQYINAIVVEFDCYLPSVLDVIDRIEDVGLEPPHFLVRSKTPGHWHVYWMIAPESAYSNIVSHTERITKFIANELGADLQGVGTERWFALPKGDIYSYAPSNKFYTYQYFKDWYEINTYHSFEEKKKQDTKSKSKLLKMDIFGHPAIKKLLQGVSVGRRDHACFTLALLFYAQGWEQSEAYDELIKWNNKNSKQVNLNQIKKCVRSAYSGKYRGPKSEYVEYLTGIPFKMQIIKEYKGEKTYQKLYDIQYRILQLIREHVTLSLSQADIAKTINAPLRSVKKALKELTELKRIRKIGGGKGPGNNAIYKLANTNIKRKRKDNATKQRFPVLHALDREVSNMGISYGAIGANRLTSSLSTGPPG